MFRPTPSSIKTGAWFMPPAEAEAQYYAKLEQANMAA